MDADGHRCDSDRQELVEQFGFRPDGDQMTGQPDRPPIEAVGMATVLVDAALELGGIPVPAREAETDMDSGNGWCLVP